MAKIIECKEAQLEIKNLNTGDENLLGNIKIKVKGNNGIVINTDALSLTYRCLGGEGELDNNIRYIRNNLWEVKLIQNEKSVEITDWIKLSNKLRKLLIRYYKIPENYLKILDYAHRNLLLSSYIDSYRDKDKALNHFYNYHIKEQQNNSLEYKEFIKVKAKEYDEKNLVRIGSEKIKGRVYGFWTDEYDRVRPLTEPNRMVEVVDKEAVMHFAVALDMNVIDLVVGFMGSFFEESEIRRCLEKESNADENIVAVKIDDVELNISREKFNKLLYNKMKYVGEYIGRLRNTKEEQLIKLFSD